VSAVLELSSLTKDYRGLRPLRIDRLALAPGDQVALAGIDQAAAEMLVNLITGASLPDRGEVRVFGRRTADIENSADWLATVDRFGIVTDRAVLLDSLSVIQNLAMPYSLEIEPPSDELRDRARALAARAGLPEDRWEAPVAELDGAGRARVRLGRALALRPAVLLLEHPTASVQRHEVAAFGRDVRAAAERGGHATLALTTDRDFASAAGLRVLALDPASGRLAEPRRSWFR
jgi:predicted ABC-type transport system involved in lysophospholipase L1 biosynthesis ATPase subunit